MADTHNFMVGGNYINNTSISYKILYEPLVCKAEWNCV